ncbi:hypothetical protein [Enterovirga aerilata]|uniref:Uncharacterized protein n=1 Tax=Enterovirga aerilata TaxID=2730920 RepID=A0A849IAA6_9HYPH|nr:hypothetical protein [Enterovirga sp. DB1703]NNM73000.1 hypothetical protein [Enterovirga sp. DB1703]
MADDPSDLTLELLRQIRAELGAFRSDVERRFELVNHRFEKLETDMLEVKRTLRGMTYMMATFTGRLEDVETRVNHIAPR